MIAAGRTYRRTDRPTDRRANRQTDRRTGEQKGGADSHRASGGSGRATGCRRRRRRAKEKAFGSVPEPDERSVGPSRRPPLGRSSAWLNAVSKFNSVISPRILSPPSLSPSSASYFSHSHQHHHYRYHLLLRKELNSFKKAQSETSPLANKQVSKQTSKQESK